MEEFATRSRGPSAAEEKRQGKADDLEDIMVGAAPASRPGTEAKGADKDKSVLGKVGEMRTRSLMRGQQGRVRSRGLRLSARARCGRWARLLWMTPRCKARRS
jgi:hypothetical protein